MKFILNVTCFLIMSLCSFSGFSAKTHSFASGMSIESELPPNDPQVFFNFLSWKVKGSCEVISGEAENPITFRMLRNKGALNGIEITPGETQFLLAKPGQHFELSADPLAKVEVINNGKLSIKIRCATI